MEREGEKERERREKNFECQHTRRTEFKMKKNNTPTTQTTTQTTTHFVQISNDTKTIGQTFSYFFMDLILSAEMQRQFIDSIGITVRRLGQILI